MPGVLRVAKYRKGAAARPPVKVVNWGSELGCDARPSRDQEPMSAQVPLVQVLFACPDTVCLLPFGQGEKAGGSLRVTAVRLEERRPRANRQERSRGSSTWKNHAKKMRNSQRARPRRMRNGLLWNTLPSSSLRKNRLPRSSRQRRSSFLRSSFLSSFPRCSCPRSTLLRSAFLEGTFLKSALPWSSLLVEWENISWKKEASKRGWLALARNLEGTYTAEI